MQWKNSSICLINNRFKKKVQKILLFSKHLKIKRRLCLFKNYQLFTDNQICALLVCTATQSLVISCRSHRNVSRRLHAALLRRWCRCREGAMSSAASPLKYHRNLHLKLYLSFLFVLMWFSAFRCDGDLKSGACTCIFAHSDAIGDSGVMSGRNKRCRWEKISRKIIVMV